MGGLVEVSDIETSLTAGEEVVSLAMDSEFAGFT